MDKTIILGAGISGLGAAYALRQAGQLPIVLEKDDTYGGLCGNFSIQGFRFDRFVHFTFAKDERVLEIFKSSSPEMLHHQPEAWNIYKRTWIKHPAQNNLFPLSAEEKRVIIDDFLKRPKVVGAIHNYEEWLRIQFGDYFAEHFPMVYTRKYWMKEARELRTEWVGQRVYQPSVDEVIAGSKTDQTPVTYYTKEMNYPAKGGFKTLLRSLAEHADIRYNNRVSVIDVGQKVVKTECGYQYTYDRLISSLPLPMVVGMLTEVPDAVKAAAETLEHTCGYHISIGLKTKNIPPYLWWYIYDEDILAARAYSPSMKSPDNAPQGCSSLQMEVYCKENAFTNEELLAGTVEKIIQMGLIKAEDILFTHIGFEPYANVVFTKPIYESRKLVRDYLSSVGIETIGRFGEWDYLWSDQSLLSGLNVGE